jgi:uncharacterized protein YndB with AHSA1/START domain
MLKWILLPLGTLVALLVIVTVVGWFLPKAHVASRSAIYRRPPAVVFDAISDVGAGAAWRPDVTRVEMLPPIDGHVRFREIGRSGRVVMQVERVTRPTTMVTRIADPSQPFGGTWTFELAPADHGTRLTITERGEVYNVIFRAVGRFVIGHTATIDAYLKALGNKFGEVVTPTSS